MRSASVVAGTMRSTIVQGKLIFFSCPSAGECRNPANSSSSVLSTRELCDKLSQDITTNADMMTLIRDMLTTAIQVNLGMISLSESEVTKKLAAWAAIIAVPTMLAGIYGMNFDHMPELKWTFGYPLTSAAMVASDAYLYVRFKKTGWL